MRQNQALVLHLTDASLQSFSLVKCISIPSQTTHIVDRASFWLWPTPLAFRARLITIDSSGINIPSQQMLIFHTAYWILQSAQLEIENRRLSINRTCSCFFNGNGDVKLKTINMYESIYVYMCCFSSCCVSLYLQKKKISVLCVFFSTFSGCHTAPFQAPSLQQYIKLTPWSLHLLKPSQADINRLSPLLNTTCWWKQSASPFGRPTPITELSVWQSGQAGVWRCVGGIEQLNSTLEDQRRLQMHLVTCQGLPPHTIWPVLFPLSGRRTSAGSSDGR